MYTSGQPDANEYLLGRKVDKYIEKVSEPTKEEKYGATFSERVKANIELDMAAKMREDPLFQIRKREEEARRRILDNPVKMKQLQKMVTEQKEERQKSKSKKSKKEKKSRSHHKDSDQSADEIMQTYLNIINKKHQDKSEEDKRDHHDNRRRHGLQRHQQKDREEGRSSRHSSHRQNDSSRNSSDSEYASKYSHNSREKSNTFHSNQRQSNYRRRSRSRSPQKYRNRSPRPPEKLNESERERKLKEMMDNAKWRDNVRQKNVKRYEEECAEEARNAGKGSSSDFLNPMMAKHAAMSSVEERLKRNKYNIQRTKMQLNSNFTER